MEVPGGFNQGSSSGVKCSHGMMNDVSLLAAETHSFNAQVQALTVTIYVFMPS
jgi:hypothetical protein